MGLEEHELRTWVRQVATEQASRRDFIRAMLGLGLAGPLIAEMLATHPSASAQETRATPQTFTPTRRGGGGKLRLLWWQAPTILNAHFAAGGKDTEASRIVYEPLISVDADGDLVPILAEEVPSLANGGRSRDGTWTIWRLKRGVVWHDGKPFTADDVIFTWEFATTRPRLPSPAAILKISTASTGSTTIRSRWCLQTQPPLVHIGRPGSAQAPLCRVQGGECPQCTV